MKQLQGIGGGVLAGAAIALITQAPALAQTRVQEVRLVEMNGEVSLLLTTQGGERPEVFVVRRGNDFVADIINTQLAIPDQNFQQSNPVPGIASVVVTQLDPTSVRVIVSGTNGAPEARIMQGASGGIVIGMGTRAGNNVAQAPANQPPVAPAAPPPTTPTQPLQNNNQPVLVPDPAVTIDGRNVPPGGIRPMDQAPPFLPRAVAPPVGDIAVSNINPTTAATIRLDNAQRIPRLVLRDAPVRDVLALLARTAGLNIAFLDGAGGAQQTGQNAQSPTSGNGPKISLDIENESVEDVFNYVLRLSGLEANRNGNTIFIGSNLPNSARNVVVRSFRLNQVNAETAAGFLVSMGAERSITREQQVTATNSVNIPGSTQALTTTDTRVTTVVETLRIQTTDSTPLLRGLQVIVDERLNSVTLIGLPNLVELASTQLVQLDLRQRQVAVNVKVLDINLTGTEAYNSSFSFGVNNTFFVNDGGAAAVNFNGFNPPDRNAVTGGLNARPIIPNPIGEQDAFFDPDQTAVTPLTAPGGGIGLLPIAPVTDRPNQVGISEYEPFERDLETGAVENLGEATFQTFPFFQYPRRFLATLQAQITSGNAKILTDPTLVVQEGESAAVALVEEAVKSSTATVNATPSGAITTQNFTFQDVGLTLTIDVERIDDNGFVTLRVRPTISAPGQRQDAGGGSFALEILRRSIDSGNIRLRDGQTLILSGIIQESERVIASKIPILGDLPLIGSLFRSTDKNNERAEVVVLVTPQILDDSDRSPYGYEYNPSPDALRMMQRR